MSKIEGETRKVNTVGGNEKNHQSFYITLPKWWVKKQVLPDSEIELYENDILVIIPKNFSPEKKQAILSKLFNL